MISTKALQPHYLQPAGHCSRYTGKQDIRAPAICKVPGVESANNAPSCGVRGTFATIPRDCTLLRELVVFPGSVARRYVSDGT